MNLQFEEEGIDMNRISKSARSRRGIGLTLAAMFVSMVGFNACSTSQSEQKQAAPPAAEIQGDAIDAPAAAATAQSEGAGEQKPHELPAQNFYAPDARSIEKEPEGLNGGAAPAPPAPANVSNAEPENDSRAPEKRSSDAAALNTAGLAAAATSTPENAGATTTPAPEAANAASPADNHSEYQRITLGLLGSFRYEYPDPVYLESEQDPAKLKLKDQFPPNIKALHGRKVSIMGYIMPIDVDEQWRVKTFTLVRDQMVCCFGNVPEINEWVYVSLKTPQHADELIDVPVVVFGTLEVGEEIKFGTLANVYRLAADRVSTDY